MKGRTQKLFQTYVSLFSGSGEILEHGTAYCVRSNVTKFSLIDENNMYLSFNLMYIIWRSLMACNAIMLLLRASVMRLLTKRGSVSLRARKQ